MLVAERKRKLQPLGNQPAGGLYRDGQRAAALGEAGREFVRANFTNEKFSADMARLYREVARGGAGGPLPEGGAVAEGGGL